MLKISKDIEYCTKGYKEAVEEYKNSNDEIINKFEGLCEEIVKLAKLVNQKNSYSDFV